MSGILSDSATNQSLLRESTENFLTGLAQALRAFQFYGASNPAALRSLSTARTSCQAIWEQTAEIDLQIHETTITLGEQVVYENDERNQSLSFLLFKDGVRALRVLRGFENEDLEPFLVVLHKAKHLRNEEDDLITLLWSADFSKIFYSYIDLGEYEEPQLEQVENTSTSFTQALAAGSLDAGVTPVQDHATTADHAGSADPDALPEQGNDVEDSVALMSNDELTYLKSELARERDRDVVCDVVNALLDRLEDPEPKIQAEILMILSDLIPSLVLQRRLELAAATLRSLREFGSKENEVDEALRTEIQNTLESIGNSSAIEGVLQALEAGDLVTEDEVVGEFLTGIGPSSLETIIRIRERTTRNSLRVTLDKAMDQAFEQHPDYFVDLCRSQDPTVACAAIQLVGRASPEPVEAHLVPLLKHRNPKIRTQVLEVMVLHGGPQLLAPLVDLLKDGNREVRCAAAWGLGTWRFPQAFAPLQTIVESKEFRDTSMNEMRAMFSAFARVGQNKSLTMLGRILNKKSLFGKRESAEMRICAARALGALKLPEAESLLRTAVDDKDINVRRAVMRSMMARGK